MTAPSIPLDDTGGDAAPTWRRWLALAVMSVATLVVFIDNTVVNTALPAISVELNASISTLQWIVDAYVLALVGLLLLGGTLGDRFGRRLWMIVGLVIFGAASVFAGLSSTAEQLIIGRALQGIGAALVLPATLSIITNTFPRGERARAIAVWTAIASVGIAIGPVVGGSIVDSFGWAAVFFLHLPVIAVALLGMLVVPESRDQRELGLDIPGAILGTVGVTALIYGIIQGNELGWTSTTILASFGIALVTLVGFIIVELRSPHPMLPLRFFRQRDFTGSVLLITILVFALIVAFFYLTQYFQIVQGRSAFEAGLLLVPVSVAMVFGAPFSTVIAKRFGPRVLVTLMTFAMVAGVLVLAQLTVDSDSLLPILAMVIFGFGAGLGMPVITDTVMAAVPERDAGVASAVNDVSREFGGALGIATIGSLVAALYRNNVEGVLPTGVPAEIGELVGEGIGIASVVAAELPEQLGTALVAAANQAFVDAMTFGFVISAGVIGSSLLIAFTLIPKRMREKQADFDEAGFEPTGDPAPGLEDAAEPVYGDVGAVPAPEGLALAPVRVTPTIPPEPARG